MELFAATLSRMGYLFTFIFLGYFLRKKNALPKESALVISKLENNLLLPAMVFNTFSGQFTTKNLVSAGKSLLCSAGIVVVLILFAVLVGRFLTKDGYLKNIYTYGLSFSNFAFMGYAVVQAIFPEYYLEYLIFTMPMWTAIYLWGVPALLIPDTDGKGGILSRLKSFCNPMFIFMVVGIVFGLAGWTKWIPTFALDVISASEKCMSPLAMMLAGITLSEVNLKTVFGDGKLYLVSLIRLVATPLLFLLAAKILPFSRVDYICALVALSLPVSLTSIVVPAGYGRDTSKASALALISHALSCLTIPLIFLFAV